jgi:hypothetical protein
MTWITVFFKLIKLVYFSKGLVRKMCKTGGGSFNMAGRAQTNQASSSMFWEAKDGSNRHYYDAKTTNTTFLFFLMPFIQALGKEAVEHQQSSGEFLLPLLRKTLQAIGSPILVCQICIYNIITYNFFNTPHRDNDSMSADGSKAVKKYIVNSAFKSLQEWLKRFERIFGDKMKLPMPTTCCWSLVKKSNDWRHLQYFIILDLLLAFDLSSDVMINNGRDGALGQVGATFYGPLIEHCTSAPLWVNKEGLVTIVCPDDECFNVAWGRGGGPTEATKARKAAENEKGKERPNKKAKKA